MASDLCAWVVLPKWFSVVFLVVASIRIQATTYMLMDDFYPTFLPTQLIHLQLDIL